MLKIEEAALSTAKSVSPRQPIVPRFLKVPAAVAYTGISRSTLYELMNAGKVKSHRVGASRLLDREALDEFITAQ